MEKNEVKMEVVGKQNAGENTQKVEQTAPQAAPIRLEDYGFAPEAMPNINGNLMLGIVSFLHSFADKETSVTYEVGGSFEETVKSGKQTLTEAGVHAIKLLETLTDWFRLQVELGVAEKTVDIIKRNQANLALESSDFESDSEDMVDPTAKSLIEEEEE